MVEKKKNWFRRHWILSTIGGLFLFFILIGMFAGDNNSNNSYSSNSDTKTKSTSKSVGIGDEGRLNDGSGDSVLVAVDKDTLDEMIKAAVAKDDYGYKQPYYEGRAYLVDKDTKVLVLERTWGGSIKFRILEGKHQNRIGWTPYEWVIPI